MKNAKAVFGIVIAMLTIIFGGEAWGDNYTDGYYAGRDLGLGSGDWNAFIGDYAGCTVGNGSYNVGLGEWGGYGIWSGNRNVFVGYNAPGYPSDGISDNVAVGHEAGYSLLSGNFNVFVGFYAGHATTTGDINTFIGTSAGAGNDGGFRNTYLGSNTGANNTSGNHNVFIGDSAGQDETGSYKLYIAPTATTTPLIYGEFNNNKLVINGNLTVTGWIVNGFSGLLNSYLGKYAGKYVSSGAHNTFIGTYAGGLDSTGNNNTFIGQAAGYQSNGSGNVFIGNGAGYYEAGSDLLYIANSVTSSPLVYGNFSSRFVKINGTLTVASDERLKKDIEPLQSSLDLVMHLRGVTYDWKDTPQEGRGFGGKKEIGLIAQEVERVLPEVVHTDATGMKSVAYVNLVPLLIEAVKEQEKEITEEHDQIQDNKRIERLERAIERIEKRIAYVSLFDNSDAEIAKAPAESMAVR